LRGACSLGTWTLHEVCHAGVCFPWEARSHCLFHSATRQARISPFASIRPLLSVWPLVSLCRRLRRRLRCSTLAAWAAVASLAAVLARLRRPSIGVGGCGGRRPRLGWCRAQSLLQVCAIARVTGCLRPYRLLHCNTLDVQRERLNRRFFFQCPGWSAPISPCGLPDALVLQLHQRTEQAGRWRLSFLASRPDLASISYRGARPPRRRAAGIC
jgi:hypothetical protein